MKKTSYQDFEGTTLFCTVPEVMGQTERTAFAIIQEPFYEDLLFDTR